MSILLTTSAVMRAINTIQEIQQKRKEAEDTPKYCRLCGSHDHVAYDCPERAKELHWEAKEDEAPSMVDLEV